MRCEGSDSIASFQEVLSLAERTGVRLEISHLKVIGKKNQHLVDEALSLIDQAHERGLDVQFDQYPYCYGSTSLFSLLPPSYLRLPLE
jgi:N-acyl-D-aspartate/D-glutamate deacylase